MNTWTLTDPPFVDGRAIYDLLRDGVPVLRSVDYNAARQYIYEHAAAADLYLEAENPRYQGDTVGTLKARDVDMRLCFDGVITYEEYCRRWPTSAPGGE